MMNRWRSLLMPLLLLAMLLPAAAAADVTTQARAMINAADLRETQVSLLAVDVDSGEVLMRLSPDEPMIPASNMKLLTTAAALKLLGPDFVFRTELTLIDAQPARRSTGQPARGPILLVRGDGDPAFGDPKLLAMHGLDFEQLVAAWVERVKEQDVRQIDRLIIDDRIFDQEFIHPTWPADQLEKPYLAQVAGFNFHTNCLALFPKPTVTGQAPTLRVFPQIPTVNIQNRALTSDSDTFWISRRQGSNNMTLGGKVQNERIAPVYVTLHDPPITFGHLLAHELEKAGITVGSVSRPGADDQLPDGRVLHVMQTTLPVILARCNKDSQNMFADALFKRLGRYITGAPGSFTSGSAALRIFLRNQLGGTRGADAAITDGSGLSRENRVTARLMVDLLRSMHHDAEVAEIYRDSLSVGSEDGTLRKRFHNAEGKIYGKSGYINSVSSLSGYLVIEGEDGVEQRVVAFSFLFNGFRPPLYNPHFQRLQERLVGLLEDELMQTATTSGIGG